MEASLPSRRRRRAVVLKSVWWSIALIGGCYMVGVTAQDTPAPTLTMNPSVSFEPSFVPTNSPRPTVTPLPSLEPSDFPTGQPTATPQPTSFPTETWRPSASPTVSPAPTSTAQPTGGPTVTRSELPSSSPSAAPSVVPSISPKPTISDAPSDAPTTTPLPSLSISPSLSPTTSFPPTDTYKPSSSPSVSLAPSVTMMPSARRPSISPTRNPTSTPYPSVSPQPSFRPTSTVQPSRSPSQSPRPSASPAPSFAPTDSFAPSLSLMPSNPPSIAPSRVPSSSPTLYPTDKPSVAPTGVPSLEPSEAPSASPSSYPSQPLLMLARNSMSIEGFKMMRRSGELWANVTSEHLKSFWADYIGPNVDINVIFVETFFFEEELEVTQEDPSISKIFYRQDINYNVRPIGNITDEEDPSLGFDPNELASRPFTHDFQRYATALWMRGVAETNFLNLVDIEIDVMSESDKTGKVVGIIVGIAAALVVIIFGVYYYQKKKRQKAILESQMEFQGFVGDVPTSIQEEVVIPQDVPQMEAKKDSISAPRDGASSELEPYSISAHSFHGQENVSELSFHADLPGDDDLPNSVEAIDEYADDMREEEDDSLSEDEEEPPAPAFAMQISPIDDLEDM